MQYYGNYKTYNEFYLIFPQNYNFSQNVQFNIDIIFPDSIDTDQAREKLIDSGMTNFQNCLISEISKKNHPSISNVNWKVINHHKIKGRTTVSLEFSSNVPKKIEVNKLEKCALTYKPILLKTVNSKINVLRDSIKIVKKFEKNINQPDWKINAVVQKYGLPFLNEITLANLEKINDEITNNEMNYLKFDISNSFSLLKSSFREKIEILISLLLIVNVLLYSIVSLKNLKNLKNLKRIKRRIFK